MFFRYKVLILISSLFLVPGLSSAAPKAAGDQGYGIMLGNPSGVSGKVWFSNVIALDGAFGVDRGEVDAHVDFLYHDSELLRKANINPPANLDMTLYFGAGPRILFADNSEFGIRFPIGISMFPHDTQWELFAEIAPVIRMTPDTGFNGDIAIGARYYFDAIRPRQ